MEGTIPETEAPDAKQDVLEQLLESQREQRAEIASLRDSLNKSRTAPPPASSTVQTPAQLRAARLEELANANYYCPGCGRTYDEPEKCEGSGEAPHPKLKVVSTEEVTNPPDHETDPAGYEKWQQGHTPGTGKERSSWS